MTIKAPVIIMIILIKVRWFKLLVFFRCPLLAIKDIGASQHLRATRGADIVSEARMVDSLCHEEDQ